MPAENGGGRDGEVSRIDRIGTARPRMPLNWPAQAQRGATFCYLAITFAGQLLFTAVILLFLPIAVASFQRRLQLDGGKPRDLKASSRATRRGNLFFCRPYAQ